jgi:hypothetical protein
MRKLLVFLALAAIVAAPSVASAQKRQRDLITDKEIAASAQKDLDALAAIRALRPQFLEPPRGVRSLGNGVQGMLLVYVDGIRQSGTDALVSIQASDVRDIKYLDPNQSQNEFGISANGGAIIVRMQKAPKKP